MAKIYEISADNIEFYDGNIILSESDVNIYDIKNIKNCDLITIPVESDKITTLKNEGFYN